MFIASTKAPASLSQSQKPPRVIPGSRGKVVDAAAISDRYQSFSKVAQMAKGTLASASLMTGVGTIAGFVTGALEISQCTALGTAAVAGGLAAFGLAKASDALSERAHFWRNASEKGLTIKADMGIFSASSDGHLWNHQLDTGLGLLDPNGDGKTLLPLKNVGIGTTLAVASVSDDALIVEGHFIEDGKQVGHHVIHGLEHNPDKLVYIPEEQAFEATDGEKIFRLYDGPNTGKPEFVEVPR